MIGDALPAVARYRLARLGDGQPVARAAPAGASASFDAEVDPTVRLSVRLEPPLDTAGETGSGHRMLLG